MAAAQGPSGSDGRRLVATSLRDVKSAREQLSRARASRPQLDLRAMRAELLAALEAYERAITQLGAPFPPKLHSEIQLYRRLTDRM